MKRSPSSQHLLARCCGAIGSAVISDDSGSLCCAHKPFCSPLAQFSMWQERMCLPVPNEPIGGSVGSNVSLAMLASLPPHHLRSPFMVSRSALLTSLALMWQWPLNSSKTPLASLFPNLFCSVCLHYPHIALDLFFPRHFAVFPLHDNVVVPLIVCLLSSRCVSRGRLHSKQSAERARIRSITPEQRLEEAYTRMMEEGACLSITGLKAAAHIGAA